MKYLSIILFIISFKCLAQVTDAIIKDAGVVLNADIGSGFRKECGEESNKKVTNIYECDCEELSDNDMDKNIVVPKDHKLHKKYGIHLLSIGSEFSAINDNHIGYFFGMYGDDFGNTFGGDVKLNSVLDSKTNLIRVGLDYQLRQFTTPLEGIAYIKADGVETHVENEQGQRYLLGTDTQAELEDEYGRRTWLRNQASMTYTMLRVNMMLENKNQASKMKSSFGASVGYKKLNDTNSQLGAKIQDNHHNNVDIYRFNYKPFERLLVNGAEEYLFIEPKARFDFPSLTKGVCKLSSSTDFSLLFNTPIAKGSNSLNIIEPKVTANINIGLFPMKKDPSKSTLNFFGSATYDPFNNVNPYTDSGVDAFSHVGMQLNGKIGKRLNFYFVPIDFYIPLGEDKGGIANKSMLSQNGNPILASELQKDILATWGRVGIVVDLGKKKGPIKGP